MDTDTTAALAVGDPALTATAVVDTDDTLVGRVLVAADALATWGTGGGAGAGQACTVNTLGNAEARAAGAETAIPDPCVAVGFVAATAPIDAVFDTMVAAGVRADMGTAADTPAWITAACGEPTELDMARALAIAFRAEVCTSKVWDVEVRGATGRETNEATRGGTETATCAGAGVAVGTERGDGVDVGRVDKEAALALTNADTLSDVELLDTAAATDSAGADTDVLRLHKEEDRDMLGGARRGGGFSSVGGSGGMDTVSAATEDEIVEAEIGLESTVVCAGAAVQTGAVMIEFTGTTGSRGSLGTAAVTDDAGAGVVANKDKRELAYDALIGACVDSVTGARGSNEMMLVAVDDGTGATASGGRTTTAKGESAVCMECRRWERGDWGGNEAEGL